MEKKNVLVTAAMANVTMEVANRPPGKSFGMKYDPNIKTATGPRFAIFPESMRNPNQFNMNVMGSYTENLSSNRKEKKLWQRKQKVRISYHSRKRKSSLRLTASKIQDHGDTLRGSMISSPSVLRKMKSSSLMKNHVVLA